MLIKQCQLEQTDTNILFDLYFDIFNIFINLFNNSPTFKEGFFLATRWQQHMINPKYSSKWPRWTYQYKGSVFVDYLKAFFSLSD